MDIKYAFVSDAATIDASGKVNVLGIFDRIWFDHYPNIWPRLYLTVCIDIHRSESNIQHTLKMELVNAQGKLVLSPHEQTFIVDRERSVPFIIGVDAIKFESSGYYTWDISVDGHFLKNVPLILGLTQERPPTTNNTSYS